MRGGLIGLALVAMLAATPSGLAWAAGTEPEPETPAAAPTPCIEADKTKCPAPAAAKPADAKPADAKPADTKPADTKPADAKPADAKPAAPEAKPCAEADKTKCPPAKQSFIDQYHAAVALIDARRYDEALVAMQALDDGSSADVINYIGFIHRKMGHMAEAQMYYEAALHMRPNHRGALEYYGEWYCMMGNVDKARQNLATIATVYGKDTKEYAALAKMIDETAAKTRS